MSTAIEENWKPNKGFSCKVSTRAPMPTPKAPASRRESPEASNVGHSQLNGQEAVSCESNNQHGIKRRENTG